MSVARLIACSAALLLAVELRAQLPNALSFSHAEGAYDAPFALAVTGVTADTVYYTLDGGVPTPAGERFGASLYIASPPPGTPDVHALVPTTRPQDELDHFKAWAPPRSPLHKARVLRVASYRDGVRTSPVYTRTYFTDGPLSARYTAPVVSLAFDPGSLFDYDTGIHVAGAHYTSASPNYSGNAFQRGRDWERHAHLTYFEAGSDRGAFRQDLGVRIHGGSSRSAAQKSLRLYARDAYGEKYFRHAFFPDLPRQDRYKRLLLRTTMSDFEGFAMIKDAVAREIIAELDLESQRSRPAVVYVNGEYWGLYELMERLDERYVAYRAGVDGDDVEIADLKELDEWSLVDFVERHDLRDPAHYAELQRRVDLDNLVTYMCAEQFLGNYDWPVNNHKYWRDGPDGPWRAIAYDFDWAFKDPEHDMFEHMLVAPDFVGWPADGFSTALWRGLIRNADFRARYTARFEELLATTFSTDSTLAALEHVRAGYRPEVAGHANRWDYPDSEAAWEEIVDRQVRDFLVARPAIARQQLRTFFDDVGATEDRSARGRAQMVLYPTVSEGEVTVAKP